MIKINFKFEPIYDAEGILYEEKEAWNIFGDFISKSKAFASANKKNQLLTQLVNLNFYFNDEHNIILVKN